MNTILGGRMSTAFFHIFKKRSVTQTRLIATGVEDGREYNTRSWQSSWPTDRDTCFSMRTFWNMSNHRAKTTAYQVYLYLNFENKSYEVHNPEPKYLISEQEPINKIVKSQGQFYCALLYSVFVFVANNARGLERACAEYNLEFCLCVFCWIL